MKLLTPDMLAEYLAEDGIGAMLERESCEGDAESYGCHRWLLESEPKRLAFEILYGDLLASKGRRILDVGGGYTAASRVLWRHHDYYVLYFMAHDSRQAVLAEQQAAGRSFWIDEDWLEFAPAKPYDLIVANDIFPNVDQRLVPFLSRYLPHCGELRLLLTFYNESRWYKVKRVDAEEVFHMLAWDGGQLRNALAPFADRILQPNLDALSAGSPSLYANGRQVCAVTLRGDAP